VKHKPSNNSLRMETIENRLPVKGKGNVFHSTMGSIRDRKIETTTNTPRDTPTKNEIDDASSCTNEQPQPHITKDIINAARHRRAECHIGSDTNRYIRVWDTQNISTKSMTATSFAYIVFTCTTLVAAVDAFAADPGNFYMARRVKERTQQISESNPMANNPDIVSSVSGVPYSSVLKGLDQLYPRAELDARNALSRKDGYWPFINEGKDPPACFTYGEFDFIFFAELLDKAHGIWKEQNGDEEIDWSDKVFIDIGSGAGRLVVASAALHPTFKVCRGIELLPGMHESAEDIVERNCRYEVPEVASIEGDVDDGVNGFVDDVIEAEEGINVDSDVPNSSVEKLAGNAANDFVNETFEINELDRSKVTFRLPIDLRESLPMAPVELVCGSFSDPYTYFGDADLIFMFSTLLNQELLTELSCAIGRQTKPGTLVITTDYQLDLTGTVPAVPGDDRLTDGIFRLELVDKVDGYCCCTGGQATAYLHRVVESVGMPQKIPRPIPTLQDISFDVAMQRERGELTDTNRFLLGVANNIRFQGLPESFVPRSYR